MYKTITLAITLFVSTASGIEVPEFKDMDKTIYTLNYIRDENKQAAEILEKLYMESTDAVERSSLSKLIDILLQSCIYLAERIKHYEENFKKNIIKHVNI